MSEPRPLHRLFGLSWIDFFEGTSVTVEMEMDLSLNEQSIDLVLTHKGPGPLPEPLPDGFEELAAHNLLTFKSYQEALDGWALCELVGHYVNYRKQASPSLDDLLPETDFRLFAVCVRFPHNLAQQVTLTPLRDGVYEGRLVTLRARVIVVNELPRAEQNARLLLFSPREELLRYGQEHFRPRSPDTSTLLSKLLLAYSEDPTMSEKLKAFYRESLDEILKTLTPEERLAGLPPEELRKRLSLEERFKDVSAEDVVKALPPEVLEAVARKLKANGSSEKPS